MRDGRSVWSWVRRSRRSSPTTTTVHMRCAPARRGSGRTARSLTTTLPATLRSTAVLLIFLSVAAVSALPTKRRLDDVLSDKAALAEGDMTPGIPSLNDVVHAFNGATTKDTDAESIVSSVKQALPATVNISFPLTTTLDDYYERCEERGTLLADLAKVGERTCRAIENSLAAGSCRAVLVFPAKAYEAPPPPVPACSTDSQAAAVPGRRRLTAANLHFVFIISAPTAGLIGQSIEEQTGTAEHASDFLGVEGLASGPAVINVSACDSASDPCCGAIDRGACMQGITPTVLPATRPRLAAMIAQILVELCK